MILQAIAEAAGVPVTSEFKSDHLFLTTGHTRHGAVGADNGGNGGGGGAPEEDKTEIVPEAELSPEPDAIEALVDGRSSAVLIVPKAVATAAGESAVESGDHVAVAAVGAANGDSQRPVVLRDAVVKGALPRGCTVILPGSYNPLHRGHVGLLEAARALYAKKISSGEIDLAGGGARERTEYAAGTGKAVSVHAAFEVSVANVDKGGLAADEVKRRTHQFSDPRGVGWPYPVVVTRAPLFSQKVGLEKHGFCFVFWRRFMIYRCFRVLLFRWSHNKSAGQ